MNYRLTGTDYETLRDTALLSRIDPWAADTAEAPPPDRFENDPDQHADWTDRILKQAEEWQQHEYADVMAATGWTADAGVAKYAHLNAQKSAIEAQQLRGLAELWEARIAEIYPPVTSKIKELVQRELASELAVALQVTDRSMMARISEAISLTTWYPATLDALEAGHITSGHAWAISSAGMVLEPHQLAHYEQAALDLAPGLTPRRLHIAHANSPPKSAKPASKNATAPPTRNASSTSTTSTTEWPASPLKARPH